jgi:alginate O-acetyltransferase complex protein AlgI
MLFNSPDFLVFFVVILLAIIVIKKRTFQHLILLAGSYFFFYFSSNYLISLLVFSTILDYYIAKEIWKTKNKKHKKILLIISLAGNLGLLGFFKYADFAILQFNILGNSLNFTNELPFLNLVLPIGISFYTFQTISYTVDVYRGNLRPSNSFKEFALFVSFFPQLVAGPIIRAKDFLPQLREKMEKSKLIKIDEHNLKLGITIMTIGFLKKMFFADNIAPMVNDVFSNAMNSSSFEIWLGTIAFGIQIYGDFSGYSDIAIGAALILGFKIPINFNKPYFANSPTDFWKRWHISLSSWLRDYLYIPLGGNRKSPSRTFVNLITVMLLGGLWHGASWNFVIWGLLHGMYLAIHKIIQKIFPTISIHPFFKSKIGKITSILVTQYFIFLAWIPFRVSDFDSMIYSITKFVLIDFELLGIYEFIFSHKVPFLIMVIFIVLNYFSFKKPNLRESLFKLNNKYWFLFIFSSITLILFFYDGNSDTFIYFQF